MNWDELIGIGHDIDVNIIDYRRGWKKNTHIAALILVLVLWDTKKKTQVTHPCIILCHVM